MRRRKVSGLAWRVAIVILLGTLRATNAWAQGFAGGLRGAVNDANGVIPGVTVSLTNEGTNISRTSVTNEVGQYTFAAVPPGVYSLRATLEGFKTFEQKALTIGTAVHHAGHPARGRRNLTSGRGGGGTPIIETSNASLGDVLTSETMLKLPSLTRNAFMMASQTPTYLPNVDPRQSRMQDQSGTSLVSLGGGLRGQTTT